MWRTLILPLLLVSAGSSAAIYRWVDADGYPQYSDRPAPSAEMLRQPQSPDAPKGGTPSGSDSSADGPLLGPYKGFEIVSPQSGETLRREDGNLPVSLILDPPLLEGHRLELMVDGSAVAVEQAATQLRLTGLPFGSHSAQARIVGPQGATVARTAPVRFHLRKPIPPGVLQ